MKNLVVAIGLFSLLQLTACGPSEAEKQAAQIAHDDSVKRAAEDEAKLRYAEKEKLTNSIQQVSTEIEGAQNRLIALKSNLEVEKDQMNKIKEWQLGRTQGEREQQISQQSITIQNTENEITSTQNNINTLRDQLSTLKAQLRQFEN